MLLEFLRALLRRQSSRDVLLMHHPHLAAEFLGRLDGLVDGKAGLAARRGDPELSQDLLALVLMDFHAVSLLVDAEEEGRVARRCAAPFSETL